MLLTAGERKATALLCMALHDLGVPADSFTGSQAGFITDGTHTNAKIVELRPERLEAALRDGHTPVVGGSQGVSGERNVTFLGRGGSDTTAVALAHALGAHSCELYTDVPGVFSADPRLVPTAHRMATVSFDEMLEMTACGCPKPAMRSVEFAAHVGRAPAHPISVHLGARHLGARGGSVHGAGHRLGCRPRHVGGQGHRLGGSRPTRHRRPVVPTPRRRRRQRRHDRAEHVGSRRHGHLVHRAPRGPDQEPGDHRVARGGDLGVRRQQRPRHRAGEPRRGRHEVEPRRRRHDLRDPRRRPASTSR